MDSEAPASNNVYEFLLNDIKMQDLLDEHGIKLVMDGPYAKYAIFPEIEEKEKEND